MKYKVNEQTFTDLGAAELYSKQSGKPVEQINEVTEKSVVEQKVVEVPKQKQIKKQSK
jgi:hypothetical protein